MVRDEADIIGTVLRHLLAEGVAGLIVADNLSTDGTRAILDALAAEDDRLVVVDDSDPAYWQGRKMTALAHLAGDRGAEWVVPFDADELWYSPAGRLAEVLESSGADVLLARVWEHVPTPFDGGASDPVLRMKRRRPDPKPARKACFRYHPSIRLWEGNHFVDHPGQVSNEDLIEIREFQYRSLEQATRKVRNGKAALDATTLAASEGSHWRALGGLPDDALSAWWTGHSEGPSVYDPAPLRCPASLR